MNGEGVVLGPQRGYLKILKKEVLLPLPLIWVKQNYTILLLENDLHKGRARYAGTFQQTN